MNNGQMIEEVSKSHAAAEGLRKIADAVSGREVKTGKKAAGFDILGWLMSAKSKKGEATKEKEKTKPAKAKAAR
jgi:hypothetical protein